MKQLYFISFVLIVTLAITACEQELVIPEHSVPQDYGITILLSTNRVKQVGAIVELVEPTVNVYDYTHFFYEHALLRVEQTDFTPIPTDSLYLRPYRDFDFTYNYYTDSLPVYKGQTYNLFVDLGNGRTVAGNTTVPQGIEPGSVTESENYYYIHWQGPDSLSYRWNFWINEGTTANPRWRLYISTFSGHSTYARLEKQHIPRGSQYYMYVYTYDQNYTDHVLNGVQTSGLSNSYGVFGSYCSDGFWIKF